MKLVSSKEVLKNRVFSVHDEIAHDPDGFEIHRNIVRHSGSAVMMAVDEQNRILLARQFRLPAKEELWELPAGRLDPGEQPLDAARRELKEETGYRAENWDHLAAFWPSPGYVGEKMDIFLARNLTAGEPHLMDDERIRIEWFPASDVHAMIRSGEIQDGKTIIGYYAWADREE